MANWSTEIFPYKSLHFRYNRNGNCASCHLFCIHFSTNAPENFIQSWPEKIFFICFILRQNSYLFSLCFRNCDFSIFFIFIFNDFGFTCNKPMDRKVYNSSEHYSFLSSQSSGDCDSSSNVMVGKRMCGLRELLLTL